MPSDPTRRLHANRPFSIPWSSTSSKGVYSRGDILTGKQPCAFGSGQSLGIAASGEDPHNQITMPQKWYNAGRVLRVPKCVILSSLPNWTSYWPGCYFYGPRAISGQMGVPPYAVGNYYYFDQWNYGDQSQQITDNTIYCNSGAGMPCGDLPSDNLIPTSSPFWNNFYPPVPDSQKEIWTQSYFNNQNQIQQSATDYIMTNTDPPSVRYSEIVGTASNPYYQLHQQLMQTFQKAKQILESDTLDPIYVTIPNWFPALYQTRNGYLTSSNFRYNAARGYDCTIIDSADCYESWPIPWGPYYPNQKDSRNAADFPCCTVPYLATTDPGFGTNVLHLYVGHACHRYDNDASIFGWQAWPLQPEGQFLGPVFLSSYLGSPLAYFCGRRVVWRDSGYDFGFMGGGAPNIYSTYSSLIGAAANQYRQQFYNYRQFGTRLFNYGVSIGVSWETSNIWKDQRSDCSTDIFYFGWEFADYVKQYSNEDNWFKDCSQDPSNPPHLRIAQAISNFPDSPSLRAAIETFYPPIQQRVNSYYGGIEQGTIDLYKLIIKNQGLADYNVQYGGNFQSLLDVDALVAYIRQYFAENP